MKKNNIEHTKSEIIEPLATNYEESNTIESTDLFDTLTDYSKLRFGGNLSEIEDILEHGLTISDIFNYYFDNIDNAKNLTLKK